MSFYGLSDEAVLRMPIRRFWALNRYVDRIRSESILAWLPAFSIGMGGEHVKGIVDQLQESVGRPMIAEQRTAKQGDIEKAKRAIASLNQKLGT